MTWEVQQKFWLSNQSLWFSTTVPRHPIMPSNFSRCAFGFYNFKESIQNQPCFQHLVLFRTLKCAAISKEVENLWSRTQWLALFIISLCEYDSLSLSIFHFLWEVDLKTFLVKERSHSKSVRWEKMADLRSRNILKWKRKKTKVAYFDSIDKLDTPEKKTPKRNHFVLFCQSTRCQFNQCFMGRFSVWGQFHQHFMCVFFVQ